MNVLSQFLRSIKLGYQFFLALTLWLPLSVQAEPVQIKSIQTSFNGGSTRDLEECINGSDTNASGWFVAPNADEPQSAVFQFSRPVQNVSMEVALCFLSGRPNSYPSDFTVSSTSDPEPSLAGKWEILTPARMDSNGPELIPYPDGHLRTRDFSNDAVFQLTFLPSARSVTGIRIEVFPSREVKGKSRLQITSRDDGDFVLTQFRVEAVPSHSTNIAFGCPVTASAPVRFPALNLTDGLPGTFSHPLSPSLGSSFYFQIDLRSVHKLDHIDLRNRGDGNSQDRLTQIKMDLYEKNPDTCKPVWQGTDRGDGSHPGAGGVDIVRQDMGSGVFTGRYLRISSNSSIAFCPQLAEVEVYEKLPLVLTAARADGVALGLNSEISVPAGTRWLALSMNMELIGLPEPLPCRWRLSGFQADWQLAHGFIAEGICPPPGNYVFEAQVQHTDGEWDSTVLSRPLTIEPYFWQTRDFQEAIASVILSMVAYLIWYFARRRLARRMAVLESRVSLNEERARIARDMHDEVGARLSQLAILQELFAREHALVGVAREAMQGLAQTTRNVIASLDEVVWAVNPKNDTLASMAGYLEHCATDYLGPVEISCRLDAPFEWPPVQVRSQVRHNLVLAFREALQNILKHSGATAVTLKLRFEASHLTIVLTDNGRGLPANLEGLGRDGMENMSARLKAIGGTFEGRSLDSGGTEVTMRVKLE